VIYRLLSWLFGPKPAPQSQICQCGHEKCYHAAGIYGCWHAPSSALSQFALCPCAYYVEIENPPEARELDELRQIAGLPAKEPRP
jgi:hypothetical protein